MAAFFVGKTGAAAEYVMIYEYRYFVYLDNSQKYLDFLAEKALYPCRFRLVGRDWKGELCVPFLVSGGLEPISKRVPSFCYF